jgi:hypothetical protein
MDEVGTEHSSASPALVQGVSYYPQDEHAAHGGSEGHT